MRGISFIKRKIISHNLYSKMQLKRLKPDTSGPKTSVKASLPPYI